MKDEVKIKAVIRKNYADSVRQGGGCCSSPVKDNMADCCGKDLGNMKLSADTVINKADLGLSCGLPVQDAGIKEGDNVLDLGSGAGVDVFRAAKVVGKTGFVTGVDMTIEMVTQARENAKQGGIENTAFKLGEIEDLPIPDNSQDVVISNCVINLVPEKNIAFQEIFRVLKPGGRFCISDIVINGEMPDDIRQDLDAWASCMAGALEKQVYLNIIGEAGFQDVQIVRSSGFDENLEDPAGFESITVVGVKPKDI